MKRSVLWFGLLLCVYALWRVRAVAGDAIGRLGWTTWASVSLLLAAGWWLAVLAWRRYVLAYTGQAMAWRVAMRQLGLLLVGKYVPGGVFGFLARLYDAPAAPRERLFWAGLAEQAIGVAMPIALGALLYLVARQESLLWLSFVFLLPLLAIVGLWTLHRLAAWLPWLRRHTANSEMPAWQKVLPAIVVQFVQLLAWVMLVALLAREFYGLNEYAALGISGSFLLAVGAGMLAIFVPGGIGVREAVLVGLTSSWLGTAGAIFLTALLRIISSLLDVFAGGIAALVGASEETR